VTHNAGQNARRHSVLQDCRNRIPPREVLIYDEANFREGGRDRFRSGPRSDPKFHGETLYHRIVPNKHVISSETLDTDGERLTISLSTFDFEPSLGGTNLKLTVQLVSLAGPGMIAGYKGGNQSALESLSRHLSANS
jgi:uncharacterized protein YndB with AHSA1/START domain